MLNAQSINLIQFLCKVYRDSFPFSNKILTGSDLSENVRQQHQNILAQPERRPWVFSNTREVHTSTTKLHTPIYQIQWRSGLLMHGTEMKLVFSYQEEHLERILKHCIPSTSV